MKLILLIAISFYSCHLDSLKTIDYGDTIAEGPMTEDSVYIGRIKFFKKKGHQLIREQEYLNGKQHGERIDYYPSGKKSSIIHYSDDKVMGNCDFYSPDGDLYARQYKYYDVSMGPTLKYSNGKVKAYSFYSFDKEELFNLNYDSIGNKKLGELSLDLFWYNKSYVRLDIDTTKVPEYFIYLLNPPTYNFIYSLCVIESNYKIIKVAKEFDPENIWEVFTLNKTELKNNQQYALRLEGKDPNEGDFVAFKILKY